MASLTHSNLIRVFDYGEVNAMLYMVMEYIPGKSLRKSAHGMAVDATQAVGIISSACKGLAHAHNNGIFHHSLRPSNILLTPEVKPKITNFGITISSNSGGYPAYSAPEIIGQPEKGNIQSDIFAMGVILRELLTGVPAGSKEFHAIDVTDSKLAAICEKATHENPNQRFRDMDSFDVALKLWKKEKVVRKPATPTPPKSYRPSTLNQPGRYAAKPDSRNRATLRTCAIIIALIGAIQLMWSLYQNKQEALARLQAEEDSKHPTIRIVCLDTETAANNQSSGISRSDLAATGID